MSNSQVGRRGLIEGSFRNLNVTTEPEAHVRRHREGDDENVVAPISICESQLDANSAKGNA